MSIYILTSDDFKSGWFKIDASSTSVVKKIMVYNKCYINPKVVRTIPILTSGVGLTRNKIMKAFSEKYECHSYSKRYKIGEHMEEAIAVLKSIAETAAKRQKPDRSFGFNDDEPDEIELGTSPNKLRRRDAMSSAQMTEKFSQKSIFERWQEDAFEFSEESEDRF